MTTVTVNIADLVMQGSVPARGYLEVQLVNAEIADPILTNAVFTVPVVNGVASFELEPSTAANGYKIKSADLPGVGTRTVQCPDVDTIGLDVLISDHSVDPKTLAPVDAPAAWWVALDTKAPKPITRTGGYSFGGTDGSYTFGNGDSYAVRDSFSIPKTVTRGRFWFDTNRDSSPATTTGNLAITNVYVGIEDPANEGQYLSTPVLVSAAPGTAGYNTRAYTPWIDFAANGWNAPGTKLLRTFVLTSTGSNMTGNSNGSNAWLSATPASAGSLALTAPFRAPCQVRAGIDYEFIDDGSQIGLFIGPSFVDSGGLTSATVGFRGQDSGWLQQWAKRTGNTAVALSVSGALSTRYSNAADPIWDKFPDVHPDFVAIPFVCGNDIAGGASLATAQTNYRAVVAAARTNFPGVPIVGFTDMPYGPGFVTGPTDAKEVVRKNFNTWLIQTGPLVTTVLDFDQPLWDPVQQVGGTYTIPTDWKMPAKYTGSDLSHPAPGFGAAALAALLPARFTGRVAS